MGQPGRSYILSSPTEYIGGGKRTQGTETSKYLQEKKSIEIPQVAASERGSARVSDMDRQCIMERYGKAYHRR